MDSPKRAAPPVPQLNGRIRKTSCNTQITASGPTLTPVPMLKVNGHITKSSHSVLLDNLDDQDLINDRPMILNMTFAGLKEAQRERLKVNSWSEVSWGDLKDATKKREKMLKQCAPAMSTPVREPREPRRRVTISPNKERTNKVLLSSPARNGEKIKSSLTLQTKLKRPLDETFSFQQALKPKNPSSASKLTPPPVFHKSQNAAKARSETHSRASSISTSALSKSNSKSKSTSNKTNTTTSSGASLSKPKKRRVLNINYNKARQQAPPDRYTKSTSSIISSKYNESSLAEIEDANADVVEPTGPTVYSVNVIVHNRMTQVSCMRKYESHLRTGFNRIAQRIENEEKQHRPIRYYSDNLQRLASEAPDADSYRSPKRKRHPNSESMSCDSSQVSQTSLPTTPQSQRSPGRDSQFGRVSQRYDPWAENNDFNDETSISIFDSKKVELLLKKSRLAASEVPDVSELNYACDSLQQHEEKIEPFMEKLRQKEKRLKKRDDQWLKSRSSSITTTDRVNQCVSTVSKSSTEHPRATIDGDMKGASFYPSAVESEDKVGDKVFVVETYFYSCQRKKFRHKEHYQPSWILTPVDLQKMKTHTAQTEKYLQQTTHQMKKKLKLEND